MVIAFFRLGSAPGFSGRAFRILLDISQRENSAPPFWDLSIEISTGPGSARHARPALQNSGRAKWGSARADRILKSRVSEKMGTPLQESANLQMSTAAPDFCFSRAQRLWDVICAIWDLLRCTEIWKSAVREFSAGKEISQQIFHLFFAALIFLMPKTANFCLGILPAGRQIFPREISDFRFQIPVGTRAEISKESRILNAQNTFQDFITDFCGTHISDFRSQNWPDF